METTSDFVAAAGDSVDTEGWLAEFDCAFAWIAGRFGRVEPRRRARLFLLGLLSDVDSRSCWQLAEQAGDASPHGMQRLLGEAVWDADEVRGGVRGYVVDALGDAGAVLVLDDTGDLKKGIRSPLEIRTAMPGMPRRWRRCWPSWAIRSTCFSLPARIAQLADTDTDVVLVADLDGRIVGVACLHVTVFYRPDRARGDPVAQPGQLALNTPTPRFGLSRASRSTSSRSSAVNGDRPGRRLGYLPLA